MYGIEGFGRTIIHCHMKFKAYLCPASFIKHDNGKLKKTYEKIVLDTTSWKVAGSIPVGVTGIFLLLAAPWPWG